MKTNAENHQSNEKGNMSEVRVETRNRKLCRSETAIKLQVFEKMSSLAKTMLSRKRRGRKVDLKP